MSLYPKYGRVGLLAILLSFVVSTALASTSMPGMNPPAMMQMPMIAPLVIQDGDFNSSLILVNGTDVSTYVDVALRSLYGQTVAIERVQFSPYEEEHISIRALRESGTAPDMTAGSITVTQNPTMTGMAVIAALAMTRNSGPVPNYIVQELVSPSTSGSQVLRGVADSSDGSPLVSISSLDSMPQHVTVRCIRAKARTFTKTVNLGPGETLLTSACTSYVDHGLDFNGYLNTLSGDRLGPVGIELTTDAMPGSFAAFGLAPHHSSEGRYFSAIPFVDPMMLKSTTTIYTGVPVGSSPLLPAGRFTPVLAMTNFSGSVRHVTVQYALSHRASKPTLRTVKTLTLAPQTSREVVLRGLNGDPLLQDSFMIKSDGSPGDVGVKLVSRSHSALHEVESLGKDLDDPNNGGDHPWTVANGITSTLLLFNNTNTAQYFNVEISAGTVVWRKAYHLQPEETKSVSINNLIRTRAKDDSGTEFPKDIPSGQVEWHMPVKDAGRGRILESNPEIDMARSFSCGVTIELCEAFFNPAVQFLGIGEITYFGSVQTEVCMNSCNGTPVGSGGSGYDYSWSMQDPSIASISGSDSSYSVTLDGNSPGNTQLDGEVADSYCGIPVSAPAPVLSLSQSPSVMSMSTGDTNQNITVSTNPSAFASSVTINHSLTSNPHSAADADATLSFTAPSTFTGDDHWAISATGSDSPSGIFSANACIDGFCAGQTTRITVPPQLLIQMMYAEAGGTGNQLAMQSLGETIENRFSSSIFNNLYTNWQNGLVAGQVALDPSITTGIQPELSVAVNVFSGAVSGWCGALSWWSPSTAQWAVVESAISSGTATFPAGTGAPTYETWTTSQQQILYVASTGLKSTGQPNFLYLAPRSSSQSAAVSTTCD